MCLTEGDCSSVNHHCNSITILGVSSNPVLSTQKKRRQYFVLDPTDVEEEGMKGSITYALNAQKEICALHKVRDGTTPVVWMSTFVCSAVEMYREFCSHLCHDCHSSSSGII